VRKETEYLKKEKGYAKLRRAELWLAPLLILVPILVSVFLINDWFVRGFSTGTSKYDGELLLAVIILAGNILFDIPFIKSLKMPSKK
jgi:hypothetical protein